MRNYDDIIGLPRFVSKNRSNMSINDRAAQFAPFAALGSMQKLFSQTEAAMPTQDPERILLLSAEDIDDGYEE